MAAYCVWCRQKLDSGSLGRGPGGDALCFNCLLTFVAGQRPERRRWERRRYNSRPAAERRFSADRRKRERLA